MTMEVTGIGGSYHRVADPDWSDPLDPSFASRPPGQRWNPPRLPCLYLNHDEQTARANVARLFVGLPYGPEDLDPTTAPILLEVEVPDGRAADAFTDRGLVAAGLSASYPVDAEGATIPHSRCQPVGKRAFDEGLDGVDCRSAAPGGHRELAWFRRGAGAEVTSRRGFDEWW